MLNRLKDSSGFDAIAAILASEGEAVLAIIADVEGPSYRPVGAMMAIFGAKKWVGTLSSGCVEADIALQAMEARKDGKPRSVTYGKGSPFLDIQLPCGGGLKILLLPNPNLEVLHRLSAQRSARRRSTLEIDAVSGAMRLVEVANAGLKGELLRLHIQPDLQFFVFGKGPEASTFSALVQSAGYPHLLLSPDAETLSEAERAGCQTRHIVAHTYPKDLVADDRTAIILFFHDHDWEPPILAGALETSAFYIGAQGSQRARDARMMMLEGLGVPPEQSSRLHGPIGLIPSARDAGTLSVSVLAEVLATALKAPA